jgi:hypothetical protein
MAIDLAEELIELRGDTARCLQAGVEDSQRTVSLQALLDWLAQRATESSGYETPLLPPGTRLVKQRGRKTAVVVEQPPQVRTVEWINDGEDPSLAPDAFVARRFAFPYLVFVLSFDEGELDGYQQLYYRAAPLDGLDAPLLQANLLNVTIGGDSPANWLCLGRQPVAELEWPARVETALRSFWATPFNLDFEAPRGSGFTRLRSLDPRVSSAAAWESASAEDPLFPLAIEWPPARLTLGEAVEETLRTAARPPYPASLAELVDVFYRLPAC